MFYEFICCKAIPTTVTEAKCIDEWCEWRAEVQYGQMICRERARKTVQSQDTDKEKIGKSGDKKK